MLKRISVQPSVKKAKWLSAVLVAEGELTKVRKPGDGTFENESDSALRALTRVNATLCNCEL
jgi:hypothetical protein